MYLLQPEKKIVEKMSVESQMSRLLGCSFTYKNYPSNKGNLRLNLLLYCEKITRKFTQIITTTKTTFEYYRGCYNSRANKLHSDFRV